MRITIKTLQQKVFQIEAEGSDTVADLKQKVFETQNHPVENQKLIYSGKVLTDTKSVESCNIKEKDFLVLMISKPKPTPAAASSPAPVASTSAAAAPAPAPAPTEPPPTSEPEASTTTTPAAPQPPNAPILTPAQATPVEAPAPTPAPAPVPQQERQFGDLSSFLTGPELQSTVQNMIEMGFEREQVMRALRASYNNPDRAVEYLFNGIPAHLEQQAQGDAPNPPPAQAQAQAQAQAPQQPAQPAAPTPAVNAPQNLFQLAQQQHRHPAAPAGGLGAGAGAGAGGGQPPLDLAALANDPQIAQLRELLMQNPAMIQPVIQQLAAQNPQLAQTLAQNPEALLQLLGGDGLDDDGEGPIPPGATVINITPEEREAIQRLEALGFPRQAVIEAYFACDKNEEMAANYLFESNFES